LVLACARPTAALDEHHAHNPRAAVVLLVYRCTAGVPPYRRMDMYFADSDLVPLLVQENYINHRPQVAGSEVRVRVRFRFRVRMRVKHNEDPVITHAFSGFGV
jgi:hypothetical protein